MLTSWLAYRHDCRAVDGVGGYVEEVGHYAPLTVGRVVCEIRSALLGRVPEPVAEYLGLVWRNGCDVS